MSIKKEKAKGKDVCKVTFQLPKDVSTSAKKVALVGDFNQWDAHATLMKKKKDGTFSVTLNLEPGREYQFRYLINDSQWENDANADRYSPSPVGNAENSVIIL